jgi:hypothetical protein
VNPEKEEVMRDVSMLKKAAATYISDIKGRNGKT